MAIFRRRSPLEQARHLHDAWLAAAHAERRYAHSSDTRAEERTRARLVAHLDAHGLSGGAYDPRGQERDSRPLPARSSVPPAPVPSSEPEPSATLLVEAPSTPLAQPLKSA
ncbi:hypothetical protein [Kineococcus auxinigenes]|uniref:hypothetical protein n=1 Tax=unclassified Kineococcus TaxID=2621656 RepID=UPI003D7EA03E